MIRVGTHWATAVLFSTVYLRRSKTVAQTQIVVRMTDKEVSDALIERARTLIEAKCIGSSACVLKDGGAEITFQYTKRA